MRKVSVLSLQPGMKLARLYDTKVFAFKFWRGVKIYSQPKSIVYFSL